jgi:hypothetical protein
MKMKNNIWSKYNYVWVTLILFLTSLGAHWTFAWKTYVQEQQEKQLPIEVSQYVNEVARDTFENWQSEFLQLIWQVAGLSFLFYLGSPQSKEGDERVEQKIDLIIKKLDPENGDKEIKAVDRKYIRTN